MKITVISDNGRVEVHAYNVLKSWLATESFVWERFVRERWWEVAAELGVELDTRGDTRGYTAVADAVEAVFGEGIWERAARIAEWEAS